MIEFCAFEFEKTPHDAVQVLLHAPDAVPRQIQELPLKLIAFGAVFDKAPTQSYPDVFTEATAWVPIATLERLAKLASDVF